MDDERGGGLFFGYQRGGKSIDNSVRVDRFGQGFDITDPPQITALLSGSNTAHPAPDTNPGDFLGKVCVPFSMAGSLSGVYPVSGVTVTIIDGPRSGEHAITDPGGYYLFEDVAGNELHLKVEKEHFEPKEVIVYRDAQTALKNPKTGLNGRITLYRAGHLGKPGIIVIGQRWPDEIRFIFEEMFLPDDPLLYVDDKSIFAMAGGFYGDGIIGIYDRYRDYQTDLSNQGMLHELMPAHQHALAMLEFGKYQGLFGWQNTAEGMAYAAARAADWQQFGKTSYDISFPLRHNEATQLLEGAAEVAAAYWGIEYLGGISHLQTQAPNRLRWAQEWLHRQY